MRLFEKCPKCGYREELNWRPSYMNNQKDIIRTDEAPELAAKLTPNVNHIIGIWTYRMTKSRTYIERMLTDVYEAEGWRRNYKLGKKGNSGEKLLNKINRTIATRHKQTQLINSLIIIVILVTSPLVLSVTNPMVFAQEKENSELTPTRSVLLGVGEKEDAKNVTFVTYQNYLINISYLSYYLIFEPYFIFNGDYYSLQDALEIYPNMLDRFDVEALPYSWKYGLNISNIPENIQAGIQNIGFKRVATNLGWSDIEIFNDEYCSGETVESWECIETKFILVKNKVYLKYDDLLPNFTCSVNRTDILIGNIQANLINNSLIIDPSIELQDADTENVGDSNPRSDNPNTNYGAIIGFTLTNDTATNVYRGYIKFNLSQVFDAMGFDAITDADLYLYHRASSPHNIDRNVTVHWVNNTHWRELAITWNNQPCGNTKWSLNGSCDSTVVDWQMVTNAGAGVTWYSWNVTTIVLQYNITDLVTSIGVFTDIGGGDIAEDGTESFSSKDNPTVSQRPILNVTYTVTIIYINVEFHMGITSANANTTNLPNATDTAFLNNTIAALTCVLGSDYNFFRWADDTIEYVDLYENHMHNITIYRSVNANYTVTAYALSGGGGGGGGASILVYGLVTGFGLVLVAVALARKR